jgi:hypothetical protein
VKATIPCSTEEARQGEGQKKTAKKCPEVALTEEAREGEWRCSCMILVRGMVGRLPATASRLQATGRKVRVLRQWSSNGRKGGGVELRWPLKGIMAERNKGDGVWYEWHHAEEGGFGL